MESPALVSCIMPTRDRRAFVPQAIRFFLRQEYPACELIVVDDGTDPVADLLPNHASIRYIRLDAHTTIGAKRNLACEQAHGTIIAHWDDDDWHAPDRISYQIAAMRAAGAELCGITRPLFYDLRDGEGWRYMYPTGRPGWLSGSSLCYTRALWSALRFTPINVGEDARFVAAAAARAAPTLVLPRCDFHVGMIHSGNVSPKHTRGTRWERIPAEEIARILGDDWATDHRNSDARPAPGEQTRSEAAMHTALAVVMTCHAAYLKWLPEALAAIDRQVPAFAERVVVFDGCAPPGPPPAGWRYLTGDWGHPAGGRNLGLAATRAPWLIFWDADNAMPEGYTAAAMARIAAADPEMALFYPDIQYCDQRMAPQRLVTMPAWDYWRLRAENFVDTAAIWRREALEMVGGWPERDDASFEDYALALSITACGWQAARLDGPPMLMRSHNESRSQASWRSGMALRHLWQARTTAIVTLLAGRDDVFARWRAFLMQAELPPRTALYVLDNSGQPEFTRRAFRACEEIAGARALTHLDFASAGGPYHGRASEPYFVKDRHLHVARLYATVLPRVREDLVLTLEDDVEPPLDALPKLGAEIGFLARAQVGAVAGAYPMAQSPSTVCAGQGDDHWGASIPLAKLRPEPIEIGFVGGGCTMWANWALQGLPVNFWWDRGLGWDAALCLQLRRRGYGVRLHGGVRCQHHLHGTVTGVLPVRMTRGVETVRLPAPTESPLAQPAALRASLRGATAVQLHPHAESWVAAESLGRAIPPYRATYPFDGLINQRHRALAERPLTAAGLINLGITGWLRREDALKLYELAYFAPGDVLEIGCHRGLSTSIMAGAMQDAGTTGAITAVDIVPAYIAQARATLAARGLDHIVIFRCGDAAVVCDELARAGRRFSLIFVDHSHTYRAVHDVCRILPELLVAGGFCLFHDFNDGRNTAQADAEYGVAQAVIDSLVEPEFTFYGIFGCTALYRRRPEMSAPEPDQEHTPMPALAGTSMA